MLAGTPPPHGSTCTAATSARHWPTPRRIRATVGWLAASRNWLAGSRISHADMAAAAAISVMDYLGEVGWDDEPAARDWYARVKSRPSFRPLLADRLPSLPPASHYVDLDF